MNNYTVRLHIVVSEIINCVTMGIIPFVTDKHAKM